MSALSLESPFPIFTDIDGNPLEDGYIYIGTANLDPVTNPIQAYWDAALAIPAVQPIRTSGGYPVRTGSPARIYVAVTDYSITVKNKNGSQVFTSPVTTDTISSGSITHVASGSEAVATTVEVKLRERETVTDRSSFQAALNSISMLDTTGNQGELIMPSVVEPTAVINLPPNLLLRGKGPNFRSSFNVPASWNTGSPLFTLDGSLVTGGWNFRQNLRDFTINLNATLDKTKLTKCIYINAAYNVTLDDIHINNATGIGIEITGSNHITLNRPVIRGLSSAQCDACIKVVSGTVTINNPDLEVGAIGLWVAGGTVTVNSSYLERCITGIKHTGGTLILNGGKTGGINAGTVCVNIAATASDLRFEANGHEVVANGGHGFYMADSTRRPTLALLNGCTGAITDTFGWFSIANGGDNGFYETRVRNEKTLVDATATTMFTLTVPNNATRAKGFVDVTIFGTVAGWAQAAQTARIAFSHPGGADVVQVATATFANPVGTGSGNYTIALSVTTVVTGSDVAIKVTADSGGAFGNGQAVAVSAEARMVQNLSDANSAKITRN